MAAPAVLRDVFNALRDAWGEEDQGCLFENGPFPVTRLDVLIYRPSPTLPYTSFATVGMSIEPMPDLPTRGGAGRAELRFARRGPLEPAEEGAIAAMLANLAIYPWNIGEGLSWGHLVGLGREFPTLPGCGAVFLSGPLSPTGQDYLPTADGPVRVINVVPVTAAERAQARAMAPIDFVQTLMADVDIFAARPTGR